MCTKGVVFALRRVVTKPNLLHVQYTIKSDIATNAFNYKKNAPWLCSLSSQFAPISLRRALLCAQGSNRFTQVNFSQLNKENTTQAILKSKVKQPFEDNEKDKTDEEKWYKGKNAWKPGLLFTTLAGFVGCGSFLVLYGAPAKDSDGNDILDEFSGLPSGLAYIKRAVRELYFIKKMIQDPSHEKLLPDPPEVPMYHKYTLVLEMTDVLVHPDWTLANGWRFKKRPGMDYFLQQVAPFFEVVVYTHEVGTTIDPIRPSMDPNGCVTYWLFRDATKYVNGVHVKDLSFLNRDLSKVIVIDCDPKAMSLQPENGFLLQKWSGDDLDRSLVDLASFLQTIAISDVEDVRKVLEFYGQFDNPLEAFKERQKQLQEQIEQKNTKQQPSKVVTSSRWSFGNWGQRN